MNDLRTIFFYLVFFVFGLIVGKWGQGYRESEPDTFEDGWRAKERGLPFGSNPHAQKTAVYVRWSQGWLKRLAEERFAREQKEEEARND